VQEGLASYFIIDVEREGLTKEQLKSAITIQDQSDAEKKVNIALSDLRKLDGNNYTYSTIVRQDVSIEYPFTGDEHLLTLLYPKTEEQIISTGSDATGIITNFTYGYKVYYKWIDAKGYEHRSLSSPPLVIKSASELDRDNIAEIQIEPLNLSQRENVYIEVYRTERDSNVYKFLTEFPNLKLRSIQTYRDTKEDSELGQIEPPIESFQIDGGNIVEVFNDRFCIAGFSQQPNKLFYSNSVIISNNLSVSFNQDQSLDFESKILGLGKMDSHLIIFTEKGIYRWNFTNEPLPIFITGGQNVILSDLNSIVDTTSGVMFKARNGIQLLNRSLGLQKIGDPVTDFDDDKILSSVQMREENEVRFILESNNILIYNYHYKRWSVIKFSAVDSVFVGGSQKLLKSNGDIFEQTKEINPESIKSIIETGWISFATYSEFKKIKSVLLTGKYEGLDSITAEFSYDYSDNVEEVTTIDKFDFSNQDGTMIGERSLSDSRLIRFLPRRQKCNAFKVKFEINSKQAIVTVISFEYLATGTLPRIIPSQQV
ncbi:MAG: hypothetical protein HAW67_01705, partial [Endozoicomonadaceae bacterium]|nr:hypothetical protein [Endozoicomonadaceae bacterium]